MSSTKLTAQTASSKKELLQVEIIPYLESLRTILVDVTHAYLGRLDSRIVYLLDFLKGRYGDANHKRSKIKCMRAAFDKLEFKPYKGRRRDLKSIEKLLAELEGILGV